jgi:poly(3-hydroxybutyrate) depolymerase
MLYTLRETQRLLLEPLVAWASASASVSAALAPPPLDRAWLAGAEVLRRATRHYGKPAWGLTSTTVDGVAVPVVERVALERPFCRLVHFERAWPAGARGGGGRGDPRVLLFAPLSGHHATLLRDTVRALLPEHEVWVTDWVDARLVPLARGPFSLDTYVQYAVDFLRHLGPDVHVMAVCQPTVPVLAAVSALSTLGEPCVPRSLTLMGGPIDTRRSPTRVNRLATERPLHWFRHTLVHTVPAGQPGAGRRVYPGFLQHLAFVSMNPERHADAHWRFFLDLVRGDEESAAAHRAFYDEYNAVLDMDADYYLETVRAVFQEHLLPRGEMRVRVDGREVRVAPGDVRTPGLLTVEGELDDISGPGQTRAAHALCTGIPEARKRHHEAPGAGHYGIFSGRRWRESICPVVRDFLREMQ